MSEIRQQLLHRRAARDLSQRATAAAKIAYHWQMAADQAQAAAWWRRAADEAARVYANNDAERYYQRALALSEAPAERADLVLSLVNVYRVASRWAEGLAQLAAIKDEIEQADSDLLHGRWQQRRGNLLFQQGDYDEALACFQRALPHFVAAAALLEQAKIFGSIGSIHWRRAEYAAALTVMRQKQEIAEEMGDLRLESEALGSIGALLSQRGEWAAALEMQQLALERARQSNDPLRVGKLQGNIGVTYAHQLQYQRAAEYFLLQYGSDRKLGDEAGVANSIGNLGTVYRLFGQFGLARACAKVRLDVAINLQDRRSLALALGDIGATFLDEAQPAAALPYLARAITVAEYLGARYLLCSYHFLRAQCWWQEGELQQAVTELRQALTQADAIGRQDILFQAQLHLIKYEYGCEQMSLAEARSALEKMLSATTAPREVAQLHFEIWRLDKAACEHRQAALGIFQELFTEAPEHSLRAPLAELLGEPVVGQVTLPPLPQEVFRDAKTLATLLTELDALLPRLLQDQDH